MLDYSHCFRKVFTNTIYAKLKRGDSLNLVGAKNTGRKRLLEDLKELASQEDTPIQVILIDLNGVKHSFDGFEEQVREQLDLPLIATSPSTNLLPEGKKENLPASNVPMDMSILLEKYDLHKKKLFLLLHNFDAILDNAEQRFPKSFFDDLNSFKNKSNISLCCVTQKPHLQSRIKYQTPDKNQIIDTLSWLDLRVIDIVKPNQSEVREEINKRLKDSIRWQEEGQKEKAIEAITDHQCPFEFLNLLSDNYEINIREIDVDSRLKKCYDKFLQNFSVRPRKKSRISFQMIKDVIDYGVNTWAKIKGKS